MTYAQMVERLALLLVTDTTDAAFAAMLPAMIEAAELRCYRDCDFPSARRVSQSVIALGDAAIAPPPDMVVPRALWLEINGAVVAELLRRDATYLREYAPNPAVRGVPRYFALTDAGTLLLAPASSGSYALRMEYTYRPAALAAGNPTTWLSERYPDLLVYAAMVFASGYQRNFGAQSDDPQMPGSWERLYQTALATARNEAALGKGWGAFDRTPAPPPAALPPSAM
jgi:hypothetical protein